MKTKTRLKEKNFFNYEYKLYLVYDESLHIIENVMQLYDVENVLKHCALQDWIMIQLVLQKQRDAKSFSIDFSFEDVRLSRESRDRAIKYKKKKTWYYFRYKNVFACDDEKILYEISRSNIYNLSSIALSMKCFVQSDAVSIKDMLLNSKIDTWLVESIQLIINIKIVKKKTLVKAKLKTIILELFDSNLSDDLNLNSTSFIYIKSKIELKSWFNDLYENQKFIDKVKKIYKRNMKNVNMKNKKTITLIMIKIFIEMRQEEHFVQVVIILVLIMFQLKLIIFFLQWLQSHININLSSSLRLNFKRDLDIEIVEARLVKKLKLITDQLTSDESIKKSKIQQLIEMSIAIMFSSTSSQSMQARSSSRLMFKKHLIHQLLLKTLLNSVSDVINQQCNQILFDQSKSLSQFMFEFKSLTNSKFKLKKSTSFDVSFDVSNSNSDLRLRASTSSIEHSDFDMNDYNDLISLQINDERISTILMKILNDKSKNSKENENIELLEINSLRKFSTSSTSMNHSDDIIVRQLLIVCRATKSLTNQLRKHLNLIQIVIDYVKIQRTQKTSQLMKLLKADHVETYEIIKVLRKNLRDESMLRALIHKSEILLFSQNDIIIDIDEKGEKKYFLHLR